MNKGTTKKFDTISSKNFHIITTRHWSRTFLKQILEILVLSAFKTFLQNSSIENKSSNRFSLSSSNLCKVFDKTPKFRQFSRISIDNRPK